MNIVVKVERDAESLLHDRNPDRVRFAKLVLHAVRELKAENFKWLARAGKAEVFIAEHGLWDEFKRSL